ncbi:MAG: hypothetical protein LUD78_04970 [Clostridiales bacterium]|nr:hypothetical protein [Clostridiales bacterium]
MTNNEWLNINGITLPELTGKSEKQINYAKHERAEWLSQESNRSAMKVWAKRLKQSGTPAFAEKCKAKGFTPEAVVEATKKSNYSFFAADAVLREQDAGALLDALNVNNFLHPIHR